MWANQCIKSNVKHQFKCSWISAIKFVLFYIECYSNNTVYYIMLFICAIMNKQ